jgi:Predicted transcriptional regulator with an HTH domain
MVEQKKFSQILQEVIDALGISDKKFAADCGITDSTLFNYLGGKTVPNWNTLRNILRVYHVHPIWLLTGEGPMFADGREPPEQPDETPETASPPPVEVPAEAPTASPDTEKTPAEREMETFVRLMRENPDPEIRKGLLAKLGVKPEGKKLDGYLPGVSEPGRHPAVHEPEADFGKDI